MHSPQENNPNRVTVIVGCYNQAPFVVDCLESIRSQTFQDFQLIIFDDASTDDSVRLIRQWIDIHAVECIFLPHAANQGICKSLNEALSCAEGEFIGEIAADDIWLPHKLESEVAALKALPEDVGFVYSNVSMIDEQGAELSRMLIEPGASFDKPPGDWILQRLVEGEMWFLPLAALIRKSCFTKVGGYDENLYYEDYDMFLRIAQSYKAVYVPVVAAEYKILPGSFGRSSQGGCAHVESDVVMFLKVIKANRGNNAIVTAAKKRLTTLVQHLYRNNCKNKNACFLKILAVHRGPKACTLMLGSFFKIPYGWFAFPVHFYRSILKKLKRCK